MDKTPINIVVIVHADSGKKTTTGQLISKCDHIYHMSECAIEKEWPVKRDFGTAKFCVSVETPGHRDLIKNVITGTSQVN